MRNRNLSLALAMVLLAGGSAFAKTHKSGGHHSKHAKVKKAGAWKRHGQQAIDNERTREIQNALIREHYLSTPANGIWNDDTKTAMARYQKDQGWQSKRVPDARAIIKLGLGPTHEAMPATELAGTNSGATSAGTAAPIQAAPQR